MRKSSKLFTILSAAMCVTALGAAPCYAEEVTINFMASLQRTVCRK